MVPIQDFADDLIKTLQEVYEIVEKATESYNFGSLLDLTNLSFAHAKPCGMGESYIVIDHKGQVFKCHMDLEKPVTSIYETNDLMSLIVASSAPPFNLPVQERKICNQCDWKLWCAGGCPVNTMHWQNHYDFPSPNCKIYKTLLPEILRLEGKRILNRQHWTIEKVNNVSNKILR